MFRIEDGREHFYQWDTNRRLIVSDPEIIEVHFCNRTDDCSLVCETYVEDDVTLVDVPNILLQTDWKIRVYAYDGNYTKHDACYEVKSRTKPADYIYTETEVKNYEEYELRLQELEEREIPTKISELFDDTDEGAENKIKMAQLADNAGYAEMAGWADYCDVAQFVYNADFANRAMCANCDENENPIADTYARKDEVPKDWQLIGEDEIMPAHIIEAGDAGITALTVVTDVDGLSKYSELMAKIEIPSSKELNTAAGSWRVGLSELEIEPPHYGNGYMLGVYGYQEFNLSQNLVNEFHQ